jgi:hypothetical protein
VVAATADRPRITWGSRSSNKKLWKTCPYQNFRSYHAWDWYINTGIMGHVFHNSIFSLCFFCFSRISDYLSAPDDLVALQFNFYGEFVCLPFYLSRNATRQTLPTSAKLTYQSAYVHRCIGSRNGTRQTLPTSVKLMYLSVYGRRDDVSGLGASPSSPSSLTHVYR